MASIIEFRRSAFQARTLASQTTAPGSADVVLFPGVRYERHAEPEPPKQRSRRSRRRDHLDLDD